MESIQFEDFFIIPRNIYRIIGRDPLKMTKTTENNGTLFRVYGVLMFIYYTYLVTGEAVNIYFLFNENILWSFGAASCVFFCLTGHFKEISFALSNKAVLNAVAELRDMFPKEVKLQKEYKVQEYFHATHFMLKVFVSVCFGFAFGWAAYPTIKSTIKLIIFGPPYERELAYFIYYPYDPFENNWYYILTFIGEFNGACMAAAFFLSVDLILLVIVQNCCMHFDYIAMKIETYSPSQNDEDDSQFLNGLVELHIKILKLSSVINDAFQLCILFNFFISSINSCLIAFPILFGGLEDAIKGSLFLAACLLQVWIICFMGQMLIDSSESIGGAVYNHPWYTGSTSYNRQLLIILQRSQKAATLKPPTMKPSSRQLFMEVMTTTYRFFCLMKTMFGDRF
ncbi:GPROR8.2 family protein [Megaselia abdita]